MVTEGVRPCPHVLPLWLPPSPQPQPHTHTLQRKCTGACPMAAMKVFLKSSVICHYSPSRVCALRATSTTSTVSLSPQLPFLFLCLPFFLFSFLALPQYPEPCSPVHVCLLKRRPEGKPGRGSVYVEFAGESLASVVCEMDVAVPPQKGEGEGAWHQAMHEAPATLFSRWGKGSSGLRALTRQPLRESCITSHP